MRLLNRAMLFIRVIPAIIHPITQKDFRYASAITTSKVSFGASGRSAVFMFVASIRTVQIRIAFPTLRQAHSASASEHVRFASSVAAYKFVRAVFAVRHEIALPQFRDALSGTASEAFIVAVIDAVDFITSVRTVVLVVALFRQWYTVSVGAFKLVFVAIVKTVAIALVVTVRTVVMPVTYESFRNANIVRPASEMSLVADYPSYTIFVIVCQMHGRGAGTDSMVIRGS